jgi:riboflavin kinase/FMN adenylyltransferase
MQDKTTWYQGKVVRGNQIGRSIQIPTINLDPAILPVDFKQGIYAALIKHQGKTYKSALYFGPRLVLGETNTILELNIFDFDKEIYDESVLFQIKDFIRGIQNFSSLEEMKKQIEKDVEKINDYFGSKNN